MPTGTSWGDQVEQESSSSTPVAPVSTKGNKQNQQKLPEPQVIQEGGLKKMIEYSFNSDGKIVKKTRTFRTETRTVTTSKNVLARRKWQKFGDSAGEATGPDPGTTSVGDDVYLVLKSKQEIHVEPTENDIKKQLQGKLVQCRYCKGDHWSTKCPYKDNLSITKPPTADTGDAAEGADAGNTPGGRYVPPSMRGGAANPRGDSMHARDDSATIRITNLPENTVENDLKELCRPFGPIQRCYLATDRETGAARGFAFISYHRRGDAENAIKALSGYGYDHLILHAEWSKPTAPK